LRESPLARERVSRVVAWAERAASDLGPGDPGGYRDEFIALAHEARELAK
jgi:hypothetical protein